MSPDPTALAGWRGDPQDILAAGTLDPGELIRRLVPPAPAWTADALCREFDLSLFFPELGQPARHALEICGACPVRQPCLDEAIADTTLDHGIRGGMSARARVAHRRATTARKRRNATHIVRGAS